MVLKNKIYLFEILISILILISKQFLNDINNFYIYIITLLGIVTVIMYNSLGMQRCDKRINKVITQITIVLILLFIIISNLSGLVVGFLKNPIEFTFLNTIKTIFFTVSLIIFEEIIRYIICKKCNDRKIFPIILITIIFITLDIIVITRNVVDLKSYTFFVLITTLIFPSVMQNIISSYLSYHVGYISPIILRVFFGLYSFIFPIYPDYGNFVISIVNLLIPVILFMATNKQIVYYEQTKEKKSINRKIWYLFIPLWFLIITLFILISGFFKYQIMAVGSGSMEPNISYGDAVIFRKFNKEYSVNDLKVGDVIVFTVNNKSIVHRVVDIKYDMNDLVVQTKGDYNKNIDKFKLTKDDIKGVVKLNIKYIGLPTIKLNEFFK